MNKQQPQKIMAADLLEVLRGRQRKCSTPAVEVHGALTISREECKDFKSLEIVNTTFTDQVTISGFQYEPHFLIDFLATKFLGGLIVEGNSGSRIDFLGGEADFLSFRGRNQFDVVSLCGLAIQHKLELSGLQLRDNFRMENTFFSELELCSSRTSDQIIVPRVITNNPMAIQHFHLAMIPVFKLLTGKP